jgi:hypothetical protein
MIGYFFFVRLEQTSSRGDERGKKKSCHHLTVNHQLKRTSNLVHDIN